MEDIIPSSTFLKVAAKGFCCGFVVGFGMYIISLGRRQLTSIFSGIGGVTN